MTDYNETPIRVPIPSNNYPHDKKTGAMVSRHPVGAIMHHPVGTLPGVDATFRNPDLGYATNTCIGSRDGRGGGGWEIHEYVPPEFVAWGNGNTDLNTRGVSIEHENDLNISIVGKPRPEVHELSARYLAKLAVRFDWRINGKVQLVARDFPNHDYYDRSVPGFGVEFNVTTHRSVALKDCPKDLDFEWIVKRANQILDGVDPALSQLEDNMAVIIKHSGVLPRLVTTSGATALSGTELAALEKVVPSYEFERRESYDAVRAAFSRVAVQSASVDMPGLADLVVRPIIEALGEDGVALTSEQVEKAAESAMRRVFADVGAGQV